jgi:hypothetical protein
MRLCSREGEEEEEEVGDLHRGSARAMFLALRLGEEEDAFTDAG